MDSFEMPDSVFTDSKIEKLEKMVRTLEEQVHNMSEEIKSLKDVPPFSG